MANLTSLGSVLKPSGLIHTRVEGNSTRLYRAAQGLNPKPHINNPARDLRGFGLNPKSLNQISLEAFRRIRTPRPGLGNSFWLVGLAGFVGFRV